MKSRSYMSSGTIKVIPFHGSILSRVAYVRPKVSHSECIPVAHPNFDHSEIENKQTTPVAVRVQFSLENKRVSACVCEIKKDRMEKWAKKRER